MVKENPIRNCSALAVGQMVERCAFLCITYHTSTKYKLAFTTLTCCNHSPLILMFFVRNNAWLKQGEPILSPQISAHTCVRVCMCTVNDSKNRHSVVSKRASGSGSIIKMHGGEFPAIPFIWGASLRQNQHALVMADAAVPGIIKDWSSDHVTPAHGLAQWNLCFPLVLPQGQDCNFDTDTTFNI